MPHGVLPIQTLRELMSAGFVEGVEEKYLNPASIDLPITREVFRLPSIFLPRPGEEVRSLIKQLGAVSHDIRQPLAMGVPYIVPVKGTWKLPQSVYGYGNPKSSIGRLNLFCRTVADGVPKFDTLTKGWSGELWILIRADSFPVLLSPGLSLSQMRLFDGKSFIDELQTDIAVEKHGLLFDRAKRKLSSHEVQRHSDSLILSLYVGEGMGYECLPRVQEVLDLNKVGAHDPHDFFRPVEPRNGKLVLQKNSFYILATEERVLVPPYLSAELRAIDPRLGEFRSHAAGYIDPGWGWGKDGNAYGRPITLEVIPFEDTLVRPGQSIARTRYEWMKEIPETAYDDASSHYTDQEGARLSKHFRR